MTALLEPDTIAESISASLLEEMWGQQIPCGGVRLLGIPPCGEPAALQLDRSKGHGRAHQACPSDFKCNECYEKWADAMRQRAKANRGVIICGQCGQVFRTLEEFARYVPIG